MQTNENLALSYRFPTCMKSKFLTSALYNHVIARWPLILCNTLHGLIWVNKKATLTMSKGSTIPRGLAELHLRDHTKIANMQVSNQHLQLAVRLYM